MLEDAEKGRELAQQNSIADLAEQQNFEAEANAFSSDISYNVQPTDEGDKVYAQVEDGDNVYAFVGGLVSSHLARKTLENEKVKQQQAVAAQQREETALLAEQKSAALDQAKAEHQLAEQTINEIWRNISVRTRSALLPLQRAWIKKKGADCENRGRGQLDRSAGTRGESTAVQLAPRPMTGPIICAAMRTEIRRRHVNGGLPPWLTRSLPCPFTTTDGMRGI